MSSNNNNGRSMIGGEYIMPNPEEYYPTVGEFLGKYVPQGKINQFRIRTAVASAPGSASTPVAFIGTYPVMSNDRNIMTWASTCGNN